jgi:hypothetical protein
LLVAGCGQSRAVFDDNPPGVSGQAGTSAGGSSSGGSSSGGGSAGHAGVSSGGRAGSMGANDGGAAGAAADSGGTAGNSSGGTSGGGSTSGAAAGGADPQIGVDCRNQRCIGGNVCVTCSTPSGLEWLCVPHPLAEPAAHAEATAHCAPPPNGYDECDGPEDCGLDQYCVAREGVDGGKRCRDEPSPPSGSCCFTCGALPDCTLCRNDGDCPEGRSCTVVFESLKGCTT